MSKITAALESAVATVIANTPKGEARATARQRAEADRAFASILRLIAPRIRHFIRQYGLVAHWDDAEQCCAIGVHRAIQAYDPDKAQFTTFVNWQLRGELQSLRFRLMTDQRPSAKKVDATTVSLQAVTTGADGEDNAMEAMIEDEHALANTEAAASNYLADNARSALIGKYLEHLRTVGMEQLKRRARARRLPPVAAEPGTPRFRSSNHGIDAVELAQLEQKIAEHRKVVERRMFDEASLDDLGTEIGVTKEKVRQIIKNAAKAMAEIAAEQPDFRVMKAYGRRPLPPRIRKSATTAPTLLPDPESPHNRLASVIAIEPDGLHPDVQSELTYRHSERISGDMRRDEQVVLHDMAAGLLH